MSLAGCAAPSARTPPLAAEAPKLVVAISVDQLSADLWDDYRPHFTGGLARLAGGTVFRNGFQGHGATETCPGHSTILTGRRPGANGIVANAWLDQSIAREDKTVYCAEDPTLPAAPPSGTALSAKQLRGQTLGDLLKSVTPASRNVAVAGKDRSAIMMSGQSADERWYWRGREFGNDLNGAATRPGVAAVNAAVASALAKPQAALAPPPLCTAKARAYQLAPGRTVGANRLGRAANDGDAFRASPELDRATLALSAALIDELRLGQGSATDIIAIGLSATDYVGHAYGSGGQEMCLQLLALDRQLGDFFNRLDQGGIDYVVILTADHGVMDIPERLRDRGVTGAARADPALTASQIGKKVGTALGIAGPVLFGSGPAGDSWISASLGPADRQRVLAEVLASYRAHPQVFGAYAKGDIAKVEIPRGDPRGWSIPERLRASFDPARSGDVLVVLKPYISPVALAGDGDAGTHGSPWDYNRRVPILFWRKGMPARSLETPAETVDIMPTLTSMIGIQPPADLEGRCLALVPGAQCQR